MNTLTTPVDPELDLVLERIVDVTPEQLWTQWTTPALKRWFCPRPWTTIDCEIDLRPGGVFGTTMQSPEGERFPNVGCYLELLPNRRLTWTTVLLPGFRPAASSPMGLPMTATLLFEPVADGTRYTAIARHGDVETCQRHAAMGFESGWGIVLDQLVAAIKG